ncbi:MAG: alpha-hydroxy acid oxidase [Rubrobacteraceae bacterium]
MTVDLDRLAEYADFEEHARETLPQAAYDHLAAGAMGNWTRDENRRAYDRWVFRKRLMVDVADTDLSTTALGTELGFPVMLAPSAFHKLSHPDGEIASATAAREMGSLMVLSTLASTSLEDVAATGVNCWFQLQIHKDRELTTSLAERAEAAGYRALCLTVDAPNYGIRPADKRNHIHLPKGVEIANFKDKPLPHHAKGDDLMAYMWDEMEQSCTWDDARWLTEQTALPIVAKGVLTGEEARRALDAGVSGIIVSNQGGRQMDGDPATLDVLPEVVEAVNGEVEVFVDGGIRQGSHVLKALALGARAVLVGRPIYWGLAAGGEPGVHKMLEIFREGLENSLQLAGVKRVSDIDRSLVMPAPGSH